MSSFGWPTGPMAERSVAQAAHSVKFRIPREKTKHLTNSTGVLDSFACRFGAELDSRSRGTPQFSVLVFKYDVFSQPALLIVTNGYNQATNDVPPPPHTHRGVYFFDFKNRQFVEVVVLECSFKLDIRFFL